MWILFREQQGSGVAYSGVLPTSSSELPSGLLLNCVSQSRARCLRSFAHKTSSCLFATSAFNSAGAQPAGLVAMQGSELILLLKVLHHIFMQADEDEAFHIGREEESGAGDMFTGTEGEQAAGSAADGAEDDNDDDEQKRQVRLLSLGTACPGT